MRVKRTSWIISFLVVISTLQLVLTFLPENVNANTLYVGGSGPGNYTSISAAVFDANNGDTVYVYSGVYYDNVWINKTISLIGEGRDTTVVNGSGSSSVIYVMGYWVNVTGFTLTNSGSTLASAGVEMWFSRYCNIANNTALNNVNGIFLETSDYNTIANNTLTMNSLSGISLYSSKGNAILNNTVDENYYGTYISRSQGSVFLDNVFTKNGIYITGPLVEHWNTHVIDTTNTANGKPIYHWKDVNGGTVPAGAGQVILANCTNVTVENQNVSDVSVGIELGFSTNNTIMNNTALFSNLHGIELTYSSDYNTIAENNASYNEEYGIMLTASHNTIENNIAISNDEAGIHLRSSYYNIIRANTAIWNYYSNIYVYSSYFNVFERNVVASDTWRHGIWVRSSGYNILEGNTALTSWKGIFLEDSGAHLVLNNTVRDCGRGISLSNSGWSQVSGNFLTGNGAGISSSSDHNIISNNTAIGNIDGIGTGNFNTVTGNVVSLNNNTGMNIGGRATIVENNTMDNNGRAGISIGNHANTLRNNSLTGNGIRLSGWDPWDWDSHIIDTSNMVNEKPVIYWKNVSLGTVPLGAGQVILANCTDIIIEHQNISKASVGILLGYSSNILITNNTVSENNMFGIELYDSSSSTIANNSILSNGDYGVSLRRSNFNKIFHNNFVDNRWQAGDERDTNQWNESYPVGGNYWSDYTGIDNCSGANQDVCPNPDGIGDVPHRFSFNREDVYPLMFPFGTIPTRPPNMFQSTLSGINLEDVKLSWSLSPDDGGGFRSVTNYDIYRNSTHSPKGVGYTLIATLPNGTSEFVDSSSGEGNPNNYFYRTCAVDLNNSSKCAVHQAAKFTTVLSSGVNLLSIPLIQSDESIITVLQTVKWDKAWTYDSLKGKWVSFMKSKPYLGELEGLDPASAIWVNVIEDSNLTIAGTVPLQTEIHLSSGWNLVGFPSFNTTYTVADLKAETGAIAVEGYSLSSPPYFLTALGDGDALETGRGYWIRMATDVSWTVENA